MDIRGVVERNKLIREGYHRFHFNISKTYYGFMKVHSRSNLDNIFHVTTHKAASQWFKKVLRDPIIYQYTGLTVTLFGSWQTRAIAKQSLSQNEFERIQQLYKGVNINEGFPKSSIAPQLYMGYPTFESIPKSDSYKCVFILRDPRDLVVSWYFSVKNSHYGSESVLQVREKLNDLTKVEGLRFAIDRLSDQGVFEAQRSWIDASQNNSKVQVLLYENFVQDNLSFLRDMLNFYDIVLPEEDLIALSMKHRFTKYSKGRLEKQEDVNSHYRKGVAGDWKNHFDGSTLDYFNSKSSNLIESLDY